MVAIQPAIFEELAFRGVSYLRSARAEKKREVLLVSAMMFAILHLSIPSIPHLFLIGFALGCCV